MTFTINLNEKDLVEAVKFWLKNTHGHDIESVYFSYDQGDEPVSGPSVNAKATVS